MSDYYWDEDKASQQVKLEPLQKMVPLYMGRLESFAKENNGYLVAGKVRTLEILIAFNQKFSFLANMG